MKKVLLVSALLCVSLILFACGDSSETSSRSTSDVIDGLSSTGLISDVVSDLPNDEFGGSREEGKRILVPSLGEDAGGRVFKFKNEKGLNEAKKYYDDLGKSSPLFYSHTHANGLFLLQMNGDMSDEDFEKLKVAMDEALK